MWTEVMSKLLWSVKLSFLIAIQLCIVTVHIVSSGQTWFDSQQFCQKHNDLLTLDTTKSDDFYWTGNYQRLSNWINILGCYNGSKFYNLDISFKMEMASAGLCQEHCNIYNHSTFAIKAEKCVCLRDDFVSPLEHINTASCNFVCNNTIDDKLSTLCGGPEAFNVFATEASLPNPGMGNCISLECSAANPNFAVHNCSDPLNVICTTKVTRSKYKSWHEHLETCANYSLYPAGKIEFPNASSSCDSLRLNTTDPKWVGIIQEMYLTQERGNYNYGKQRKQVVMCQKCRAGSCMFSNCNENLTNQVFCQNMTAVNLISTKRQADKDLLGSILAPIVITVVTGIIVSIGVVIYRRRQRFRNESSSNMKNDVTCSSKAMDNKYSEAQNQARSESYFVLEKSNQNYDLAAHKNNNAGSSYSFTEEGQYDHLRGKNHLEKETDDTYHHASLVKASDYSDYDVTRTQKVPEIENTYDKAGFIEKSENEYNELKLRNEDI